MQDGRNCLHRIRGRVHADHSIATAVHEAVEGREQNACDVVRWMVRLQAYAQDAALAHGVTAMGFNPYFAGGQNKILVAHELGCSGGDFRSDGPMQPLQVVFSCLIFEDELTKFTDCLTLDRGKCLLVMSVLYEAAHI